MAKNKTRYLQLMHTAIGAALRGRDVAARSSSILVSTKAAGHDRTTRADLNSNAAVVTFLQANTSEYLILSEETKHNLENPWDLDKVVVIDPIDGSTNLNLGMLYWSVGISFVEKGQVVACAVAGADGSVYSAALGHGAFLNDVRIHVSTLDTLEGAFVAWDNSYNPEETAEVIARMAMLNPAPWHKNIGSAVLTTAQVAAGIWNVHYHWAFKPWDIAAALLLVPEAGGIITDLKTLEPATLETQKAVCGNAKIVQIILDQVDPV